MNVRRSKSAFLYEEVRLALHTGRYAPGDRIDPAALANEFKTSPTPVRFALYRLVGEGVIADHAREGFHVPHFTELALRSHYDWMGRLLAIACDIGLTSTAGPRDEAEVPAETGDVVVATRLLFEHIALTANHVNLIRAVQHASDTLGPIRRVEATLIGDADTELAVLRRLWRRRYFKALKRALNDYHERRKLLVPHIVDLSIRNAATLISDHQPGRGEIIIQ